MSKLTTDEERTKYAKESEIIKYSTNILEEKDGREKPKIILRELTDEKNHVWTIIFKFKTLDNISQEVIMGTLDDTPERKEKAIEIINLIRGQLEENLIAKEGYKNYEELSSYVKSENIPFILTPEGTNILSCKSKDVVEIKRTYKENDNGEIVSLYEKEDIDQMKTNQNAELNEYIKQKRLIQKWEERREKILKILDIDEKKHDFIKGENITEFLKTTDKDINKQKDIVADYLLEATEENVEENPKLSLLKVYLKIKEKGIAIDIKRVLESLENNYYKNIKERQGKISQEDYNKLEIIDDYKTFFDLVKTAKDWNARVFALKLKRINFSNLKKIVQTVKNNDPELIQYLDLKERMITEVQTDNIEVDYNKHNSVKELDKFLVHSSVREKTKEDDEHVISGIYQYVKREIIASNFKEMELYNHYAEKSDIPVYQLPKDEEKAKQMDISKTTQKICDDITKKTIDQER